jgi:hypothetical protein
VAIRSDETEEKLTGNTLRRTLRGLGRMLNQRSPEAVARETTKLQEAKKLKGTLKIDPINPSKRGMVEPSLPRQPSTLPSTPQKRNTSDTSFGTRSTETTPTKLVKPETDVQHLQNDMVADVLDSLYGRDYIKVDWPRGRKLNLCYEQ